jgi:hypothetical protein
MSSTRYECNYDAIVEMQTSEVGVQEILQYSQALLTEDQIRQIIQGLQRIANDRLETQDASMDPQFASDVEAI